MSNLERLFPASTLASPRGRPVTSIDDGRALAQAIVDTIREPVLVLDRDLRVLTANRSFYLMFRMKRQDVQGRRVYALGNGQWNIPELRVLLENIAPQHAMMEAYEIEHDFSGIGRRTLLLNARKVFSDDDLPTAILLAIEDVTDRSINEREHQSHATLTAELKASLAREQALQREMHELTQRQVMQGQEFEHRLINSLQLIVSLLSLQSRTAATPEASAQLTIAARRIGALGRVHRRLHLLDHQDHVEFKRYLELLCEDLAGLLLQESAGFGIVVEAAAAEIPTVSAIPLGFIVNELITNSTKYAKGHITVRFETTSAGYSLSVLDDGPGLPAGFDPAQSTGLGMKIVLALVKQIGGELDIAPEDDGHGTRFTITFGVPGAAADWAAKGA